MADDPNAGLPPEPPAPPGLITPLDMGNAAPPRVHSMPDQAPKSQEEKQASRSITPENNPAETFDQAFQRLLTERGERISMNTPTRKLEVPPIEGYHLHWFAESNIPGALRAWYEFVRPSEMPTMDRLIGGRSPDSSSTDLGQSQISLIGGTGPTGRPEALVLMKVRKEFYFQDQRKIAQRNLLVLQQIFHKKAPLRAEGESEGDYNMRYTREAIFDMSNGRFRPRAA